MPTVQTTTKDTGGRQFTSINPTSCEPCNTARQLTPNARHRQHLPLQCIFFLFLSKNRYSIFHTSPIKRGS